MLLVAAESRIRSNVGAFGGNGSMLLKQIFASRKPRAEYFCRFSALPRYGRLAGNTIQFKLCTYEFSAVMTELIAGNEYLDTS